MAPSVIGWRSFFIKIEMYTSVIFGRPYGLYLRYNLSLPLWQRVCYNREYEEDFGTNANSK